MISLNLISPKQKHVLKLDRSYKLSENLLSVLVLFSIILSIFLVPLNKKVKDFDQAIILKKEEVQFKNRNLAVKIEDLNQQMALLTQIQQEFFDWSTYLTEISLLVPDMVSLSQISNDLSTKEVVIRGYAQTRNDLIQFNENLEASSLFYDVKIPLSNFLTQEAITFEIKAKVGNFKESSL